MIVARYMVSDEIPPEPQKRGWVCPVCEAVMAPWMGSCVNCTGEKKPIINENWKPIINPRGTGKL